MTRLRRSATPLLGLLSAAVVSTSGCVAVEVPIGSAGGESAPAAQSPPAEGSAAGPEQRMARVIFDRVNAEREARGLEPVAWNEDLAQIARDWSADMAERGVLEHQDVREVLTGDTLTGFTGLGENIFTASGPVPAGVAHVGWMRSDDHRVNVLNPGWDRLGVGVFCAPDGSVWAAQEFGRTVDADRPPVDREMPPVDPIVRPEEDGPACS